MITDFDEIWYEYYTTGGHPKSLIFNLIHLLTAMWWSHKFMRQEHHYSKYWNVAIVVTHSGRENDRNHVKQSDSEIHGKNSEINRN